MQNNFIPYGRQWLDEDDIKAVVDVLKSDFLTTGPKVKEFEEEFAKYQETKYAVAVTSGTAALELAVKTLDLPQGSEIITTPLTFTATAFAAIYNNCTPVLVDIDKNNLNIDPKQIGKKITQKTKAIIYIDYAGQTPDIDEIIRIAKKHNLYTIEDAAHAVGTKYKGKKTGSFADLTIFSLHPVKTITTGEGGVITTNSEELYNKLLMLRNVGVDKTPAQRIAGTTWEYDVIDLGRNYRLPDINCALGLSQLKKADKFIELRKKIVERYDTEFSKIPELILVKKEKYCEAGWHLYPILVNKVDRRKFFEKMRQKQIGINVHYIPLYKLSYYKRNFDWKEEDYPNANWIYERLITLPLFPKMTKEDVNRVINCVKQTIEEIKHEKI